MSTHKIPAPLTSLVMVDTLDRLAEGSEAFASRVKPLERKGLLTSKGRVNKKGKDVLASCTAELRAAAAKAGAHNCKLPRK
jgi:hypothetical protein